MITSRKLHAPLLLCLVLALGFAGQVAATPITPGFAPLANNHGAVPTCVLRAGSLAIDHGSNPLGLAWDARGPGYARAFTKPPPSLPDMVAFEFGASPVPPGTIFGVQ